MKLILRIYLILTSFFVYNNGYAIQWTVSNDPTRPAQFTSVESAINAAANGDTILVAGSQTTYVIATNPLIINKSIILIGEGVNNPDGFSTNLQVGSMTFGRLNPTQSCNDSKIIGITFNSVAITINGDFLGSSALERTIDNVEFLGCKFIYSGLVFSNIYNNCKIQNCLFDFVDIRFYDSPTNLSISNSVFFTNNSYFLSSNVNLNHQIFVKNCLFLNRTNNLFFSINGIVVENCIFYKSEPTGTITNSIFNNNLTYLCNNNTLPPAGSGNSGSGNIENTNPLFINYPPLGADFAWTHDYGLLAGSPAIGAGTGGTNIGLTGGTYPLNQLKGNSPLPVVTSLSLPNSSVPLNGTLQGNIQAKVRN
ncbi:MAG: hypothetical protein IPM42_09880 [Saprospiraceae bacterium]|nr:hypothetical protein [Saprospiraceae bacterium]